jgi:nitric oxide reductase NorD protein
MKADNSFAPSPLAKRLAVLQGIDKAAYTALQNFLPSIDESSKAEDLIALVDLLCQTFTEEPAGTLALIERLDGLVPEPVSVKVLRRWALDGLQRHRTAHSKRLQYFETSDPLGFADPETQFDTDQVLAHRATLLHYLTGFGVTDLQIDLHAPQVGPTSPQRISVSNDFLLIPQRWSGFSANGLHERKLMYRAAVAHAAAHLQYSPQHLPAGNRHPMLLAMMGLIEDARVERLMAEKYPGLVTLWGRFHVATRESVGFDLNGLAARLARALHDPKYADKNDWVLLGKQMFEDAATNLHDTLKFEIIGRRLAVECTKMRLPFDANSYCVMPAYRDDNVLLWDFNAELSESAEDTEVLDHFELRKQKKEPLHPLPEVEINLQAKRLYPEWDYKLDTLHEDWATVILASRPRPKNKVRHFSKSHELHNSLRFNSLARIPDRSLRLKRLYEGDELDIDAAVESIVQRAGGLAPEPRIFMRHGRRRRSTAILLLMDLSESTKRFVPGSFISVLDIEKRAATLVADSLDASRDRVAVHGFSSNGRNEVHYVSIKDFDDPFGPEQKAKLKNQEGHLSTRIGAALRHASVLLKEEISERKIILLLTDGEPSDVDVFEEDYLVEDARHAVASAKAVGIDSFCLTLDRNADSYVRRIFGSRNYLIADKAGSFADSTAQTLVKLIGK